MKKLFVAAAIATVLTGCAPVKHVPVVVNPSVVAEIPAPIYPWFEMANHHEGTVRLIIRVGPNNLPKDVKVFQSSGYRELDREAVTAAWKWPYRAKTVDGVPVEAYVEMPVAFHL